MTTTVKPSIPVSALTSQKLLQETLACLDLMGVWCRLLIAKSRILLPLGLWSQHSLAGLNSPVAW